MSISSTSAKDDDRKQVELAKKIYDPVLALLKELQEQNEERD